MKTKNILLVALMVLLTGMVSCKKDHDIPTGKTFNEGSGGGGSTASYTVSVSADPSNGGTVSGGGEYQKGQICVVAASANEGYVFNHWTENGNQVSNNVSYSFTVTEDRNLVANFAASSGNYTITAMASPIEGGTVSGGGTYMQGQTCTVTAIANEGYTFTNWTENDTQVSSDANYSFSVSDNRTLVANFTLCDYSNIILNELNGDTKFIEIYNKGDIDLPLNGMYIMKDDYVAGTTWIADATIVVPAHGYVLLYSEDVQIDMPYYPEALIFHSGLSSKKTIRITLFMPDGTVRDEFTRGTTGEWGQTVSNVAPQSYARTPDGGDWKLADPTPGEANPATGEDIPDVGTAINYTITVSANPSDGGMVSGGGTYQEGQTCTVQAVANSGYSFSNWTENGNVVSTDVNYSFLVTDNRLLVANFGFGQGEGSGTADDPYNVAAGIAQQSAEPVAWVHGYIVGVVKSGLSLVTSNDDINWSAPFDLASNVLIADDATCHEISQCIIVNLPAGKPLRTQVNLMDNPENLGKHLAVNGKLRNYFGQAGLRDSNGTEADFVLEGGVTPPTPGTEIFSETFATGQGNFTIYDAILPSELNFVWTHAPSYSCMKASAFVSGQNYVAESWLISPAINLAGVSAATLKFEQAINYASPQGSLSVMISTNYNGDFAAATWTQLNLDQWPAGNNWTFINSTASLSSYLGQTVTIAFKYTSTTSASATWEVKNFVVE